MLFSVLKKLNFEGTLEIIDSNDKIYRFGTSNPHVCIRLKNKSIERKLFLNPNLHIGEAYMNEELVIENTDLALSRTCKKLSVSFYNYSAAPIFITGTKRGSHEWIIEFIEEPKNKEKFINLLDGELRKINSDYDAKRYKDIAIKQPKVHFVKTGFFDYWLKSKGKLGGQNKIPRLSNDRKYLDSMLEH